MEVKRADAAVKPDRHFQYAMRHMRSKSLPGLVSNLLSLALPLLMPWLSRDAALVGSLECPDSPWEQMEWRTTHSGCAHDDVKHQEGKGGDLELITSRAPPHDEHRRGS